MFHVAAQAYALRSRADEERKMKDKNRLRSLSGSGAFRVSTPRESFEKLCSDPDPYGNEEDIWFGEEDLMIRIKMEEFIDTVEEEDALTEVQVGSENLMNGED